MAVADALKFTKPDTGAGESVVAGEWITDSDLQGIINQIYADFPTGGGKVYAADVPLVAGVAKTVTHGLGTLDVDVTTYDAAKQRILLDVTATAVNTISLTSSTSQTVRVVVK